MCDLYFLITLVKYVYKECPEWPRLKGGPSEGPRLHGGHLSPVVAGACPPSAQDLPSFCAGSALFPVDLRGAQGEDKAPRLHRKAVFIYKSK